MIKPPGYAPNTQTKTHSAALKDQSVKTSSMSILRTPRQILVIGCWTKLYKADFGLIPPISCGLLHSLSL